MLPDQSRARLSSSRRRELGDAEVKQVLAKIYNKAAPPRSPQAMSLAAAEETPLIAAPSLCEQARRFLRRSALRSLNPALSGVNAGHDLNANAHMLQQPARVSSETIDGMIFLSPLL